MSVYCLKAVEVHLQQKRVIIWSVTSLLECVHRVPRNARFFYFTVGSANVHGFP